MSEENNSLDVMTRVNLARIVQLVEEAVNREDVKKEFKHLPATFLKYKADFYDTGIDQQAIAILKVYEKYVRKAFIENGFYMPMKKRSNVEQRIAFATDILENKRDVITAVISDLFSVYAPVSAEVFLDALLREHDATHDAAENHILSNLLVRISLFEDIFQEFTIAS